jgi:MraZ protein
VLFTGSYEHTIDSKNRLAIPADIRSRWSPEVDGSAWYATPWPGGSIRLYTETMFVHRSADYSSTLTPDPDQAELLTTLFGLARRVEMDSAGRIRLPEETLALVGLGSEVALVGAGDWLDIRDRAAWRESTRSRLEGLPGLMKRLEEKRRGSPDGG